MRCFTCGKPMADKCEPFIEHVNKEKSNDNSTNSNNLDIEYIDVSKNHSNKSIEGIILDKMDIERYCCRRMILTNVHLL